MGKAIRTIHAFGRQRPLGWWGALLDISLVLFIYYACRTYLEHR